MNSLLWLMLLAGLAVATALATAQGGGFVLLVIPPWRIELSIAAFVVVVMLLMVLGFFVTRLTVGTLSLPTTIRALRLGRRRARAREAVLQAVAAFFDGHYARAEQAAAQALQQGESVGMCAVVAARAAHAQRRFEARDTYLGTLHSMLPADRVLQLTTRADLLLDERRNQEALEVLRQAREIAPRSQSVRRLTLRAQIVLRQWDKVLGTLQALEKANAIDGPQADAVRRQAQQELLTRSGQDEKSLRDFWKTLASSEKLDRALALAAARRFQALGCLDDARSILEQALEHQWDSELADLYGQCPSAQVLHQIERAELWLQQHSHDASLLLSLGRLCLHQSLWGKAQSYLEASLALESSLEGRQLLDTLLLRLRSREESGNPTGSHGRGRGGGSGLGGPGSGTDTTYRQRPLPPEFEGG